MLKKEISKQTSKQTSMSDGPCFVYILACAWSTSDDCILTQDHSAMYVKPKQGVLK